MDFFDNLTEVTNNLNDISFTRFATVTSVNKNTCSCKEDEGVTHENVLTLSSKVKVGDTVVLGFVANSIYNPIIVGVDNIENYIKEPATDGNNGQVLTTDGHGGRSWTTVQGGGAGVVMVGSFRINDEGHLIVTLPTGTLNPYHIDENGHLIYSTNPQIGGK